MIYSLSFILENNAFLAILGVSVLSGLISFYFLNKEKYSLSSQRAVRVFFLIWGLVFLLEYFIFGPWSYIAMDAEGNLSVAADFYNAQIDDNRRFSHGISGGQDIYLWLPGMQYFQPEVLLFRYLPIWIVILLHKMAIGSLGFWGSYLLARQVAPGNRSIAVAAAAIFPVAHIYLLEFSTGFGTGFAAIPLAVYACTIGTRKDNFWWLLLGTTAVMSIADPVKVYPAMLVAVLGGLVMFPGAIIKRSVIAVGIFTVVAIANWHEVIFALYAGTGFTMRGAGAAEVQHDFLQSFITATRIIFYFSPLSFAALVAIAVLAVRRNDYFWRGSVAFIAPVMAYTIAASFPWELIGLALINKLGHNYMSLAFPALAVPLLAKALISLPTIIKPAAGIGLTLRPTAMLLAFSLAILAWNKGKNFGNLLWFGGQSTFFGYENLKRPNWKPDRNFRTVTLFETPNANIVSTFYGFDTFDGQPNVSQTRWAKYWTNVVYRNPKHGLKERIGVDWTLWNGKTYDVERHINLQLLRIANVRYLFSAFPLKSDQLKLLAAPTDGELARARREQFASIADFILYRIKRIFDPGDLFVYEMDNALPRLFAARGVEIVKNSIDDISLIKRIEETSLSRRIIVAEENAAALGRAADMTVLSSTRVQDGYDVALKAPDGGILTINDSCLPFWKVVADGKDLVVVPANGVHWAIRVPPGTQKVEIRYNRPLLRELIARNL
jgi:hypothetical protein